MSAPKNYTVRAMLDKADDVEVEKLMAQHPLWKRRAAREAVARRKFAARIRNAGKTQTI